MQMGTCSWLYARQKGDLLAENHIQMRMLVQKKGTVQLGADVITSQITCVTSRLLVFRQVLIVLV